MRITLEQRTPLNWKIRMLLPLGAILLAMGISSLLIVWGGGNIIEVWWLIFYGALGSRLAFFATLAKMAPLVFTGLAVVVAFKAGFINIGGEGQLLAGAFAAAAVGIIPLELSGWVHIPLILLAGFAAGGLWALLPAVLKVRLRVDDVVSTLLLNFVIFYLLGAMLDGPWRDPFTGWPRSPEINPSACFPTIISRSQFHLGILLALAAAAVIYILMTRTVLGFRIKMTGENARTAFFTGIPTGRIFLTAAFLSGGLAGLAGVGEVCAIQHYLVSDISPGFGYFGIVVAVLGGLHPIGVVLGALYFSVVLTGAESMSRVTGIPIYLANFIQGVTLITMVSVILLDRYRVVIERRQNSNYDSKPKTPRTESFPEPGVREISSLTTPGDR